MAPVTNLHCGETLKIQGDKLIVSSASEAEWLDNIIELGWKVYLCSAPPLLYQTAGDRRIREYSDLAWAGDTRRAGFVGSGTVENDIAVRRQSGQMFVDPLGFDRDCARDAPRVE